MDEFLTKKRIILNPPPKKKEEEKTEKLVQKNRFDAADETDEGKTTANMTTLS